MRVLIILENSLQPQDSLNCTPSLFPTALQHGRSLSLAAELNSGDDTLEDQTYVRTCATCKQDARTIDRFSGDRQEKLKWSKCDRDQDHHLGIVGIGFVMF